MSGTPPPATPMLDATDEFGGVAVTDGYGAYGRFGADGRRQACRAHRLRETGRLAKEYGGVAPPETRRVRQELRGGRKSALQAAKSLAAQGAH